jgi:hypothetical protein
VNSVVSGFHNGDEDTTVFGFRTGETCSTGDTSAPWRQHADRLAADLPADRTGWDGTPLDDAGRRLYALREDGYTGPIDQDGYPDTTSDDARTLRDMAAHRGEDTAWWHSGPPQPRRTDTNTHTDHDCDGA